MKVYELLLGPMQMNCYVMANEQGDCFVVDPGANPEKVLHFLQKNHLQLKGILLTHGHYDHIGAVKGLREAYPAAPLYLGEQEESIVRWSKEYLEQHGYAGVADYIIEQATPVVDGELLTLGELTLQVMHTPGHTKGGVIYYGEGVMFSGDTLFFEEIGRCDLPSGSYPIMQETLARIAGLSGDYKVYPGHEKATTLAHERTHNPYMNR